MNIVSDFEKFVKFEQFEQAKKLISHLPFDYDYQKLLNFCLKKKLEKSFIFLINETNLKLNEFNNWLIYACSDQGLVSVVKCLLEKKEVNPSNRENNAIISAIKNQHYTVIDLLLEDKRVNPFDDDGMAIYYATLNNDFNLIVKLFKHPKVDLSIDYSEMIEVAYNHGFNDIFDFFVKNVENISYLKPRNPKLVEYFKLQKKVLKIQNF